jgi:hypothetical protein
MHPDGTVRHHHLPERHTANMGYGVTIETADPQYDRAVGYTNTIAANGREASFARTSGNVAHFNRSRRTLRRHLADLHVHHEPCHLHALIQNGLDGIAQPKCGGNQWSRLRPVRTATGIDVVTGQRYSVNISWRSPRPATTASMDVSGVGTSSGSVSAGRSLCDGCLPRSERLW